jgi:predicted transcriptional regulator
MSQVVAFRPGVELHEKLQVLCESMQQHKSDVLRQVLKVVSVEQLRQAAQEPRPERAERVAS